MLGHDVDAGENVVSASAQVGEYDRRFRKGFCQILHLLRGGMYLRDQVKSGRQIHDLRPLRGVVTVIGHVIAELAQPDKAELPVAVLDLAQRFIYAKRRDDAASAETALVPFHVFCHFTVPLTIVLRGLGLVAPGRRYDPAPDPAFVQVSHKLIHVARDQMPLKVLAVVTGYVQVRVENPASRLRFGLPIQRLPDQELAQRHQSRPHPLPPVNMRHGSLPSIIEFAAQTNYACRCH